MQTTLLILQLVSAVLLVVAIMIQEREGGLGEAIGGSSSSSGFKTTKRGAEKLIGNITIALLVIFLGLSFALNFV